MYGMVTAGMFLACQDSDDQEYPDMNRDPYEADGSIQKDAAVHRFLVN
jgi:hypothetical protein